MSAGSGPIEQSLFDMRTEYMTGDVAVDRGQTVIKKDPMAESVSNTNKLQLQE